MTVDETKGVNFAVWAPNARTVQVVGDFNGWDGRQHGMRGSDPGIWELFVPDAKAGRTLQVPIADRRTVTGSTKAIRWASPRNCRRMTASIVADLIRTSVADDQEWMQRRSWNRCTVRTDVDLRSPSRQLDARGRRSHGWFNYRELAKRLVDYCQRMNFTHVELMPDQRASVHRLVGLSNRRLLRRHQPLRHARRLHVSLSITATRTRSACCSTGSPPTSPKTATDWHQFDGTPLYEHADPRQGEHPDWGTMIFNYGRNEVRNFLSPTPCFGWTNITSMDCASTRSLRCCTSITAAKQGQWIPNQYGGRENLEAIDFLREFNTAVHEKYPGVADDRRRIDRLAGRFPSRSTMAGWASR